MILIQRRQTFFQLILLLTACLFFCAVHWLKISSLWGDQARWLFEASRAANGEVVYRDFLWQFPPLSLLLMSAAFRLFGSTFQAALIVLDTLGVAIVLLTWIVARQLLSSRIAFIVSLAFICAMGFGGGPNFTFFSLDVYTPAQLTGMIGILLFTRAIIVYVQRGTLTKASWCVWALGSTIGLLSKPEFALGSIGGLIAVLWLDRRRRTIKAQLRWTAIVVAITVLPAIAIYAVIGYIAGFDNLIAGISGYGAGAFVCPWWPTGISLFGVLMALGQGALAIAVLSLPRFNALHQRYRRGYWLLWCLGVLGVLLTIVYLPSLLNVNGFSAVTLYAAWVKLISLDSTLLPVMWISIVMYIILIARSFKGQPLTDRSRLLVVLWTIVIAMSLRGLFGDLAAIVPLVALAGLPIWWILSAYLLLAVLNHLKAGDSQLWSRVVLSAAALYSLIWFVQGALDQSRTAYDTLSTEAGQIEVADHGLSVQVYQYITGHTLDHENILDVNYGGGINFAARRSSPIYTTQFVYLAPAQKYRERDLDNIQRNPPALIIANDRPNLNATFGVIAPTRCTFPRLVWRPDQLAYDPAETFPVIDYIQSHYSAAASIDGVVVLWQNTQ